MYHSPSFFCDYFWSDLSGLQYALYGGRCDDWTHGGTSYLSVTDTPACASWYVGACIFP